MYSPKKWLTMVAFIATSGMSTFAQDTVKKALLVIDVQENLLKPSSKMHMDTAAIPGFLLNLNKTIDHCSAEGMPVIYTINEWTNPLLNAMTGNVCKKGADGTGIDPKVHLVNNHIFKKSQASALANKQLLAYLKENSISQLYITGLFAEFCVKATAKDAIKKGFRVWVIEDAVGSKNDKKLIRSMEHCVNNGATLIKEAQLVRK